MSHWSCPLSLSDINAAHPSVMAEIFVGIFKVRLPKKNGEPPDKPNVLTGECHPGNGLGLVLALSNPVYLSVNFWKVVACTVLLKNKLIILN